MNAKFKRALEIIFEICAGLLLVAIVYFWATKRPGDNIPIKWFAFLVLTLVVFGYPVYWARTHLGSATWWLCWSLFLGVHLVVIGMFLATITALPLLLFLLIGLGEASLIFPMLLKIEMREGSKKQAGKHSTQYTLSQAKSTRSEK